MSTIKISRAIRRSRTTSYAGLTVIKRLSDQLELQDSFNAPEFIKVHGHALTAIYLSLILKSIIGAKSMDDFENQLNDDRFLRKICHFTKKLGKTVLGRNMNRFKPTILKGEYYSVITKLKTQGIVTLKRIAIDSTFIEVTGKTYQKAAKGWSNGKIVLGYRLSVAFDLDSKLPIAYILTAGNKHDSQMLIPLIEIIKSKYGTTPDLVVLDRGYYGAEFLRYLSENGIEWVIPLKKYEPVINSFERLTTERFLRSRKYNCHYCDDYLLINGYGYLRVIWIVSSTVEDWMPPELQSGDWWGLLTNRTDNSPNSVIANYKARWEIEVFFRGSKQRLALTKLPSHRFNLIQAHIFFVFIGFILLMLVQHLTVTTNCELRIELAILQKQAIFVQAVYFERNKELIIHFTTKNWLYTHFEEVSLL